jgi:hypothetical protein
MKRYTEVSMRPHYESWQQLSLGKRAFAIESKISPSSFYYWVKKFDRSGKKRPLQKSGINLSETLFVIFSLPKRGYTLTFLPLGLKSLILEAL